MMNIDKIPVEYRPLSPLKYLGYSLLFNIPVIGFIVLIIFSLSNININRRNFARSYLIVYIVLFIGSIVFSLFGGFAYVINILK
jgi:hypothetical protein